MNAQIETVEEVSESYARAFDNDNWKALQLLILDGINWQKSQDETKYKELLDSHNELLELIKSDSVYALLRQGVKRPSSIGMDDCDENDYFELYNISTKLRNQQS
jgi:hypothetical protein